MTIEDDYKQKLIDTKQQWAEDGRGLTGEKPAQDKPRLPPGQRLKIGRASCRESV